MCVNLNGHYSNIGDTIDSLEPRHGDGFARKAHRGDGREGVLLRPPPPWQRGTNENINGPIRDCFPKGTDFAKVTDREAHEMQDQLNGGPKKTLGWKTPVEAFVELTAKTV